MKIIITFALLVCVALSALPKTFDIRVQPTIAAYYDFSVMYEPVCEGYVWAQQLAQIVSNIASIKLTTKKTLSGQQVLECISHSNDVCKQVTLENIQAGINYIQKNGLTTNYCYLNKYLEKPSQFCKRKCHDDEPFPENIKAIFQNADDTEGLLRQIGNGQSSGFLIVKLYDKMNYYSSQNPQNMKAEGDFYGYGVGQIVGWKQENEKIKAMIRLGGNGWGYKGYGYVDTTDKDIVVKAYSVRLLQFLPFISQQ